MREIDIPKENLGSLPDWIEETNLGNKKGARRQYRYGNFHFREYDSKFSVHRDKFDPREKPLEHLIFDAPEVLVGISCGLIDGYKASKKFKDPGAKLIAGLVAGAISGYVGYKAFERLKGV